MQHLRTFVAAFATLLFVTTPLAAQDWGRGGLEVSAFYGVWNGIGFDADDFEGDPDPVLFEIGNNDYYGGRLGYVFPFGLGVEGFYGRLAGADIDLSGGDSEVTGQQYGGELLWYFNAERAFQIFLAGGASNQSFEVNPGSVTGVAEIAPKEDFFAWHYGAGVKLYFTKNLALRLDWRNHVAPEGMKDIRQKFSDLPSDAENPDLKTTTFTAGLSWFLGGPSDEDGDGVVDEMDLCPGTPEGVEVDADGCPFDDDGDGVYNYMDDCPDTPAGARVDASGCPTDADGDGVFDGLDQCPNTPAGATVDAEGCPVDSDGDGVFDGLDQCPNTPAGATVDAEGCGEFEAALAQGRLVLRGINFAFNSAELDEDSREVLDQVAVAIRNAIANRPGIEIEIGGHTDAIGSEAYNLQLSQRRAQSVHDYLVSVEPSIDEALNNEGYGESQPVASNDTDEGRAENRRVEFVVTEND